MQVLGTDTNEAILITKDGQQFSISFTSKFIMAHRILDLVR